TIATAPAAAASQTTFRRREACGLSVVLKGTWVDESGKAGVWLDTPGSVPTAGRNGRVLRNPSGSDDWLSRMAAPPFACASGDAPSARARHGGPSPVEPSIDRTASANSSIVP